MNHGDKDQIEFGTNVFGKYYGGLPKLPKANYPDKFPDYLHLYVQFIQFTEYKILCQQYRILC